MSMPVVLTSCTPVRVLGPAVPPKDVVVSMTVGGAAGSGDVSARSGGPNGSGTVPVSPAIETWLHYQTKPGKPATVEVQCEFEIR
jgi:hypothetical protein